MRNRKILTLLLTLMVILVTSIPAFADDTSITRDPITTTSITTTTDSNTTTTQITNAVIMTREDQALADALSKIYGITVTPKAIADLHSTDIGYGEISKAYGFSALSGKTVSDILTMKQTLGWGQIAQSLGVKVSDITKSDEAVQHAVKHDKSIEKTENQADKNADQNNSTAKSDHKSSNGSSNSSSGSSKGSASGSGNGNSHGNRGSHGK